MSTENEEWRENSYNEENTGAGRDGNKSYNREGGERPYRPSYNREGGNVVWYCLTRKAGIRKSHFQKKEGREPFLVYRSKGMGSLHADTNIILVRTKRPTAMPKGLQGWKNGAQAKTEKELPGAVFCGKTLTGRTIFRCKSLMRTVFYMG